MYILVKEDVAVGHALVAVAHASLAAYLKFRDASETVAWLAGPFYKAVCRVNDKEFEKAKEAGDYVVITESKLDDAEVALAFKPREEWPKNFKFFRLYK